MYCIILIVIAVFPCLVNRLEYKTSKKKYRKQKKQKKNKCGKNWNELKRIRKELEKRTEKMNLRRFKKIMKLLFTSKYLKGTFKVAFIVCYLIARNLVILRISDLLIVISSWMRGSNLVIVISSWNKTLMLQIVMIVLACDTLCVPCHVVFHHYVQSLWLPQFP